MFGQVFVGQAVWIFDREVQAAQVVLRSMQSRLAAPVLAKQQGAVAAAQGYRALAVELCLPL